MNGNVTIYDVGESMRSQLPLGGGRILAETKSNSPLGSVVGIVELRRRKNGLRQYLLVGYDTHTIRLFNLADTKDKQLPHCKTETNSFPAKFTGIHPVYTGIYPAPSDGKIFVVALTYETGPCRLYKVYADEKIKVLLHPGPSPNSKSKNILPCGEFLVESSRGDTITIYKIPRSQSAEIIVKGEAAKILRTDGPRKCSIVQNKNFSGSNDITIFSSREVVCVRYGAKDKDQKAANLPLKRIEKYLEDLLAEKGSDAGSAYQKIYVELERRNTSQLRRGYLDAVKRDQTKGHHLITLCRLRETLQIVLEVVEIHEWLAQNKVIALKRKLEQKDWESVLKGDDKKSLRQLFLNRRKAARSKLKKEFEHYKMDTKFSEDVDSQLMSVEVRFDPHQMKVQVSQRGDVAALKRHLNDRLGIPVCQQTITFEGKILPDDASLSDSGIKSGMSVELSVAYLLVERLTSGMQKMYPPENVFSWLLYETRKTTKDRVINPLEESLYVEERLEHVKSLVYYLLLDIGYLKGDKEGKLASSFLEKFKLEEAESEAVRGFHLLDSLTLDNHIVASTACQRLVRGNITSSEAMHCVHNLSAFGLEEYGMQIIKYIFDSTATQSHRSLHGHALCIRVLLSNRLWAPAFEYIRKQSRGNDNMHSVLINYIFRWFQSRNDLASLITFALNPQEEKELEAFLGKRFGQNQLLLYHLHRGSVEKAIGTNNALFCSKKALREDKKRPESLLDHRIILTYANTFPETYFSEEFKALGKENIGI
eukprot:CAMPEP_0167751208 /NCGR_PEP_ID=MMETSP0110_2-20121227/6431_1 /TAXON_ID=629695 /ORGANISM="Gymnochlora sp., Strain CCMP2014" /LENGTH=763 /DNA_ID=CAMNT_0007636639 /DNA_START=332 /DNA_END=2623 /DNA_ORIENTATION=-